MREPGPHHNACPFPLPDDSDDVRFYRGRAQPRVRASTILDAYVLMLLAGKGEEFRARVAEYDFELRAPAGFINLIKDQLVKHDVHRLSSLAASMAKSDRPTCNDFEDLPRDDEVLVAAAVVADPSEGQS